MDKNFSWFTTADLREYADKYICIVNQQVVTANEDPEAAYKSAKLKYPDQEIVLWKVPYGDTFIFGY